MKQSQINYDISYLWFQSVDRGDKYAIVSINSHSDIFSRLHQKLWTP